MMPYYFGRVVTPERIQGRSQYTGLSALHDRSKAPRKRRQRIWPQPVKYILTDGGSEFQGQFARLIRESPAIEQWLAYPKCPKMNAHQEDCIDHTEDLLFADTEAFNDRLWEYLT